MDHLVSMVVVAGGSGKRFGSSLPKQFHLLNGKPILIHTLERLLSANKSMELVLVLPEDQFSFWEKCCDEYSFNHPHTLVKGEKERFFSVKNGLNAVSANAAVIGVHDGVRPLLSTDLIERCIEHATSNGSAIPAIASTDSIRIEGENGFAHFDRSKVRRIQTPQCFQREWIMTAYDQTFRPDFTDDASVVEKMGYAIDLVEGDENNIKVTSPRDLAIAEALMKRLEA